jgi:hypothetical protein
MPASRFTRSTRSTWPSQPRSDSRRNALSTYQSLLATANKRIAANARTGNGSDTEAWKRPRYFHAGVSWAEYARRCGLSIDRECISKVSVLMALQSVKSRRKTYYSGPTIHPRDFEGCRESVVHEAATRCDSRQRISFFHVQRSGPRLDCNPKVLARQEINRIGMSLRDTAI